MTPKKPNRRDFLKQSAGAVTVAGTAAGAVPASTPTPVPPAAPAPGESTVSGLEHFIANVARSVSLRTRAEAIATIQSVYGCTPNFEHTKDFELSYFKVIEPGVFIIPRAIGSALMEKALSRTAFAKDVDRYELAGKRLVLPVLGEPDSCQVELRRCPLGAFAISLDTSERFPALTAEMLSASLVWKLDLACFVGRGVGHPRGFMDHPATIVVSGARSARKVAVKMAAAMFPHSLRRALVREPRSHAVAQGRHRREDSRRASVPARLATHLHRAHAVWQFGLRRPEVLCSGSVA